MPDHPTLPYHNPKLAIEKRVEDLLNRMTLAEKVAQLSGAWLNEFSEVSTREQPWSFSAEKAKARIGGGIGQVTRPAGGNSLKPVQVAEATAAVQAFLLEQTRLGIPAMVHDECCSGFMARNASVFPQMIGMASTWDPDLMEAITGVIRAQMRSVGVHNGLAPVLDVTRDPRWGRVEETCGEDPYLIAAIGSAYIRGLQGPDLTQGVAATGKHFAAHGMPESALNWGPVHVGKREFREVYLFPFEAAIKEAHLATIMNAYHELDGVPCGASRELLTDILRSEWGFDGIVTSDYNTLPMLVDYHFVAADKSEAARIALYAGLDVELPGTDCYGEPLLKAVEAGKIDPALVDRAVRRVLAMKFRLGLFENPYGNPALAAEIFDTPAQRSLARQAARESIVLLKNKGGLLPLKPNLGSIAVIGPNAAAPRHMIGDYSYASMTDLMDGGQQPPEKTRYPEKMPSMESILESIRGRVSKDTAVHYAQGCAITGADRSGFAEAVEAVRAADVAVIVAGGRSGLMSGDTCGECNDRASLGLTGIQEELVKAILDTGKPVALVLVDGRPAAIPELTERVPAILEAWLPGEEGGPAVAEVLFGDTNPGGKLPISFPRSTGQVPSFYGRKPSGGRSFPFNDYVELSAKPLFPFGHGLSYTQFEYSDLRVTPQVGPDGNVSIQVTIKNSGDRPGDEVVQLYVHDLLASVTRPVNELKGFRRISLQPGEERQVVFTLPAAMLAFYNLQMDYTVEPGKVDIMIGSSAEDIRLTGQFEITGKITLVKRKIFFSQSEIKTP